MPTAGVKVLPPFPPQSFVSVLIRYYTLLLQSLFHLHHYYDFRYLFLFFPKLSNLSNSSMPIGPTAVLHVYCLLNFHGKHSHEP
jgi:hypothetical protein